MKHQNTIVTIDPGASGAIAVFGKGEIQAVRMPISIYEMNDYFTMINETYTNVTVFIEKVSAFRGENTSKLKIIFKELFKEHTDPEILFDAFEEIRSKGDNAPGKSFGINKMLKNYAELLTVIKLQGFRFVEVPAVTWQTTLGLKIKRPDDANDGQFKTMRKNLYKEYAQKHFPSLKVNLMTSDALCLIQFVYVKMSDDIEWIRERLQNKKSDQLKINLK